MAENKIPEEFEVKNVVSALLEAIKILIELYEMPPETRKKLLEDLDRIQEKITKKPQ